MLILLRKAGDCIQLGDNIRIFLIKVKGSKIKLGIEASRDVIITEQKGDLQERRETKTQSPPAENPPS